MRVPAPSVEPYDYDAFLSQMHLFVHGEAGLWEAPWESTVVGHDVTERHGPWPPGSCWWVLLGWFHAGLLGLYCRRPGDDEPYDLAPEEASAVLAAPEDVDRRLATLVPRHNSTHNPGR